MSLLIFIFLIAAAATDSGAADRPVISVSPNWGKIFKGETITLTCNVDSASGRYYAYYNWYKDNKAIYKNEQSLTISSAELQDSGDYTCKLTDGDRSDPLTLQVSNDYVILQTPPAVYEGDSPTLRCHHWVGKTASITTFSRGSQLINWSKTDSELHLTHVNDLDSGTYACSKLIVHTFQTTKYEDALEITVRELFSKPELKVPPYPLTAGNAVTLTCETRLALPRAHTELQFAFYINGQKVQEFGKSNKYRVKSAELYHSGDYTCDVRTSSGSVQKTSRRAGIKIEGAASRPVISMSPNWGKILTEESVTLTCNTDATDQTNQRYYWFKDSQFIHGKGKTFTVTSAETRDSGDYRCQTRRGGLSDPIKLDVSSGRLILQAPHSVYEGDVLRIRCHYRAGYSKSYLRYYKDNKQIRYLQPEVELKLENTDSSSAGTHQCKAGYDVEDSTQITVEELFSDPEIIVTPDSQTLGAAVTLTCHTRLAPLRADTDIRFAFYRDGSKQGYFKQSNTYKIQYDSSDYTCEAKSGSVIKTSRKLNLETEANRPEISASPNTGKIFRGESITLTCSLDQYGRSIWLKGSQSMASRDKTIIILSADKMDSGDYHCKTSNSYRSDPFTLEVSDGAAVRPVISAAPNTSRIFTGDSVTLICNVDSMDEGYQVYYWYKGPDYIYITGKRFTVHSAELDDSGDYRCCTDNGDRSDPFTLDVSEDVSLTKILVVMKPPGGLVLERERLDVTCSVDRGSGLLDFSWCRQNGATCEEKQGVDSQEAHFVVESVEESYSGEYYCSVTILQLQARIRSEAVRISVIVPASDARIHANREDLEMVAGDNVTFTCSVERGSSPSFLWRHNGQEVDDQSGLYQIRESGKTLYIESVSSHHGGTYQCRASNQFSPDRTFTAESNVLTITVLVPVSDARIHINREDLEMVDGDNVTFTCSVEQGSSSSFLWHHNEQEIDDQSGLYQIRESGKTLYIESVISDHGGTYQCRASNQFSRGRTFTAESNVLTISVSEKTSRFLTPTISLVLLLVLLTIAILVFRYRHKLPFIFTKGRQPKPGTDETFFKAQVRAAPRPQNQINGSNSGAQEPSEYRNVPVGGDNEGEDVCYSYIDIHCQPQDSSSPSPDNYSVVYSAVKRLSATEDKIKDPDQEISTSCSNIYENFSST